MSQRADQATCTQSLWLSMCVSHFSMRTVFGSQSLVNPAASLSWHSFKLRMSGGQCKAWGANGKCHAANRRAHSLVCESSRGWFGRSARQFLQHLRQNQGMRPSNWLAAQAAHCSQPANLFLRWARGIQHNYTSARAQGSSTN